MGSKLRIKVKMRNAYDRTLEGERGGIGSREDSATANAPLPCLFSVAEFSVLLPCAGTSGIAQFGISLMIETRKGKPLNGTPLRVSLRKECTVRGECVRSDHHDHHDHHHFTRPYSSVSAVIHRLICYMLLIDAGEAVGNRSWSLVSAREDAASRRVKRAHEIRFAHGSFVPTASPLFYLIDSRGMYLMRA